MNNNGKVSSWYSWPVIILALCFFWPLGLYLLIKRSSLDKTAVMKNSSGKGLKTTGIVLIAFGGIGVATSFDPFNFGALIVFAFFIIGGIILMNKAKNIRTEGENIKQYLSIIVNGNVRQLDTIASTTGKSYDVVHKDVKKMISKGYLKNAYIDEGAREVVLPNSAPAPQNNMNIATANSALAQPKIVACPCCGANNTIYGVAGECEYCGSPLK